MRYRRTSAVIGGYFMLVTFGGILLIPVTALAVMSVSLGFDFLAAVAMWFLIVWAIWMALIRPCVIVTDDSVEVVQFCQTVRFPAATVRRAVVRQGGKVEIVLEGGRAVSPLAFARLAHPDMVSNENARLLCKRIMAARKHHRTRGADPKAAGYKRRLEYGPIGTAVVLGLVFLVSVVVAVIPS